MKKVLFLLIVGSGLVLGSENRGKIEDDNKKEGFTRLPKYTDEQKAFNFDRETGAREGVKRFYMFKGEKLSAKDYRKGRSWPTFLADQKDDFVENYGTFLVQYSAQQAAIATFDLVSGVVIGGAWNWWRSSEIEQVRDQQALAQAEKELKMSFNDFVKTLSADNEQALNKLEKLNSLAKNLGLFERHEKLLAYLKSTKMQNITEKELKAKMEEVGLSESEVAILGAFEQLKATIGQNMLQEEGLLEQRREDHFQTFSQNEKVYKQAWKVYQNQQPSAPEQPAPEKLPAFKPKYEPESDRKWNVCREVEQFNVAQKKLAELEARFLMRDKENPDSFEVMDQFIQEFEAAKQELQIIQKCKDESIRAYYRDKGIAEKARADYEEALKKVEYWRAWVSRNSTKWMPDFIQAKQELRLCAERKQEAEKFFDNTLITKNDTLEKADFLPNQEVDIEFASPA